MACRLESHLCSKSNTYGNTYSVFKRFMHQVAQSTT